MNTAFEGSAAISDPMEFCSLSGRALDELFGRAAAGPVPQGDAEGVLLILPGTPVSAPLACAVRQLVWQGKRFDAAGGSMVNRVLPFSLPAVEARVRTESSRFDGKPCHVLDYADTSRIARGIRDELREVGLGLYLGLVYWRGLRIGRFALKVGNGAGA